MTSSLVTIRAVDMRDDMQQEAIACAMRVCTPLRHLAPAIALFDCTMIACTCAGPGAPRCGKRHGSIHKEALRRQI